MKWIERFLALPVFEDEDKRRTSSLLQAALLSLLVVAIGVLIWLLVALGSPANYDHWFTLLSAVFLGLVSLGLYVLLRRGYVTLVGALLSSALWLILTAWLYSSAYLLDASLLGYFIVIVIAALTVGGRAATLFGLSTGVALLGAIYIKTSGVLMLPLGRVDHFDLVMIILSLGVMTTLLRSAARSTAEAFERARRHERALLESNQSLVHEIAERKRAEDELRNRERFLALLNDITAAALETTDLPTMLQILADQLGDLFGADGCYITLWDEATQSPIPGAAYGAWRDRYATVRAESGEVTITASVLSAGRALAIPDVYDTPYVSKRIAGLFPDRAVLGLPLVAGDQRMGAALIAFNTAHEFTADEIERGEGVTRQIALAIARVQLYTQTQRRLQEQIALREAGAAITSALDLHTVLHCIAEQMGRLIDATSAYICGVGPGTTLSTVLAEYIGPHACPQEQISDMGHTYELSDPPFLGKMRAGQHDISQRDGPELARADREHMLQYGAQTVLYIPLTVKGQLMGFAELWESRRPREFTAQEIALCQSIAQQAAIAIENARLYEETHHLKAFNEDIVQSVAEAILMSDARGRITFCNPAAEALLGYEKRELIGLSWSRLMPQQDQLNMAEDVSQHSRAALRRFETHLANKSGQIIPVIISACPVVKEDQFTGMLIALTDITDRVLAEREREQLIEELGAFAHTVAHELKNPLARVVGAAEALEQFIDTLTTDEIKYYLQMIARAGRKMNNIVDELLLLSSVRQAEIEPEPLEMAPIVAEAIQRLDDVVCEYQARVIVLPGAAWPVALGYGTWIEEVWVNYISNAIKYGGRPPCVELGYSILDSVSGESRPQIPNPKSQILFWVRDNGPGLTQEEQKRLFIPFERLDRVHATGYGLGLSIVRRIIMYCLARPIGANHLQKVDSAFQAVSADGPVPLGRC